MVFGARCHAVAAGDLSYQHTAIARIESLDQFRQSLLNFLLARLGKYLPELFQVRVAGGPTAGSSGNNTPDLMRI